MSPSFKRATATNIINSLTHLKPATTYRHLDLSQKTRSVCEKIVRKWTRVCYSKEHESTESQEEKY